MADLSYQQKHKCWLHKTRHWLLEWCRIIFMGCLCLLTTVCSVVPEYVDHLLSAYTRLAATMYKQRHYRLQKLFI